MSPTIFLIFCLGVFLPRKYKKFAESNPIEWREIPLSKAQVEKKWNKTCNGRWQVTKQVSGWS